MQVFSEQVNTTSTNGFLNILQTESFDEIFYNVFEVQINGNKYPLEKISEYQGSPVVSVPIFVEGVEIFYPFVLSKGEQEFIFNRKNTLDSTYPENNLDQIKEQVEIFEDDEDDGVLVEEEVDIFEISKLETKRNEILEEIKLAKEEAQQHFQKLKSKNLKESTSNFEKDKFQLDETLKIARSELLEDFLSVTDKIKENLFELSTTTESNLIGLVDDKIKVISENLKNSLDESFENSSKHFDKNVKQVIKELYQALVIPKVNKELLTISTDIVEKISEIETGLHNKFDEEFSNKADKSIVDGINIELESVQKLNVELNDNINKGISKALSRVGKVSKEIEIFSKDLEGFSAEIDKKIEESAKEISDYYTDRLELVENNAFELNDKTRSYFVDLIRESRDSLVEEIRKTKEQSPVEYIVESIGKNDPQIISIDKLKKEYDTIIHNKFENYKTDLRKYIAVYGGGGGSVAMQFASGGTMKGNLTVTGSISASQYFGLPASFGGNTSYVHTQLIPSTTWNILHNLNRFPSITITDSSGSVVYGEIKYISNNQIFASFTGAFSGIAYAN
jgi:hypothetical protein